MDTYAVARSNSHFLHATPGLRERYVRWMQRELQAEREGRWREHTAKSARDGWSDSSRKATVHVAYYMSCTHRRVGGKIPVTAHRISRGPGFISSDMKINLASNCDTLAGDAPERDAPERDALATEHEKSIIERSV